MGGSRKRRTTRAEEARQGGLTIRETSRRGQRGAELDDDIRSFQVALIRCVTGMEGTQREGLFRALHQVLSDPPPPPPAAVN
jgi:hypothetical protein